jgi:hypothetical protein
MEKMTKIATFNQIGILAPLYEENSTIVESITVTDVNIKMKINEFFLVRVNVAKLAIFFFILRNRRHMQAPV